MAHFFRQLFGFGLTIFFVIASGGLCLATVTNGDFSNQLTGWTTLGDVSTATSYTYPNPQGGTINPTTGTEVAELTTAGTAARQAIGSFLGVSPGRLNKLVPEKVISGSALKTTFAGVTGGTVTFDWQVWTRDYYPPFNDVAFVTLSGPGIATPDEISLLTSLTSLSEFASDQPNSNGPANGTGWNYTTTLNLPGTGDYTIGFGVMDAGSAVSDVTYMYVDNVVATGVPEPSTALAAMFAFGLICWLPLRRSVIRGRIQA